MPVQFAPVNESVADAPSRYRALGPAHLEAIAARHGLPADLVEATRLLSLVLPFRVNDHVLDHLVDWARVPDDPVFQLVFPQDGMLSSEHVRALSVAAPRGGSRTPELARLVRTIRAELNPHPAGQLSANVPHDADGEAVPGLQHKYAETVLYFPSHGQTCHQASTRRRCCGTSWSHPAATRGCRSPGAPASA